MKVTTAPAPDLLNTNGSTETLLPPYSSTPLTTQSIPSSEPPPPPASVPLEKVSEAVAAYLDGEEGRTKLRTTIGEEVVKEIEKRNVLAQPVPSLSLNPSAVVAPVPAVPDAGFAGPKARPIVVKQVYAVYCNICGTNVDSVHYHCGVCDSGDFDLCEKCIDEGKHCNNGEHWMIKRSIVNGEVISGRELIASTTTASTRQVEDQPNKTEKEAKEGKEEAGDISGRTCNCCCEGMFL